MSDKNGVKFSTVDPEDDGSVPITLNVISNTPSPYGYNILQMFYKGAYENSIAFMDAKDKETGEVVPILIGFTMKEDGTFDSFPIAKCLSAEEVNKYLAPDLKGGFHGEFD